MHIHSNTTVSGGAIVLKGSFGEPLAEKNAFPRNGAHFVFLNIELRTIQINKKGISQTQHPLMSSPKTISSFRLPTSLEWFTSREHSNIVPKVVFFTRDYSIDIRTVCGISNNPQKLWTNSTPELAMRQQFFDDLSKSETLLAG